MDSVTWRKDGVEVGPEFTQTRTLTDTVSATYQHTLSSDSVAEFVGSFTCEVRDAAGNTDSRTLGYGGKLGRSTQYPPPPPPQKKQTNKY